MFTKEQKREIEQIIRAVLKTDPDGAIKEHVDQVIYGKGKGE